PAAAVDWHRVDCTIWVGFGATGKSPDEVANKGARLPGGNVPAVCHEANYTCTPVPYITNGVQVGTDFSGYSCTNGHPECTPSIVAYYDFSGPLGNNRYCLDNTLGRNKNPCPWCGDPVIALTGNKFQAETDFREGRLEFTRYYNSVDVPENVM